MVQDFVLSPRPLSSLSALLPFTLKHDGTKRPWRWAGEEQQHLFPQTNNVGECEGWRSGVTGSRQALVISRLAAPISWVNEELLPCSGRWWVWGEGDENRQGWTPMQAPVDNVQGKKCQNSSKCICLWWTPSNTRLQYEDLFPQEKEGGNWSINGRMDTYPRHCFTGHSILEKTSFCLSANGDN